MGRLLANKYSGENKRREHDQYITPIKPVVALVNLLGNELTFSVDSILDPCAGYGVWGKVVKSIFTEATLYGIDIDDSLTKPDMYDFWQTDDYLNGNLANKKFDLIISNPPFKLAEKFVIESFKHVAYGGTIAFMFPLGFVSSVGRYKRMFSSPEYKPNKILVSSRRIDFTGQGSPHTDIAMFIWHAVGKGTEHTFVDWFDWEE